MKFRKNKWEGCYVAMITPFKKDLSVDLEGVRKLVNYFISKGVTGILTCGTTGESATMKHEEDLSVIKTVMDEVGDRVPVIAGTGSNNTNEALEYTHDAVDLGVDACLVVCPYYNKPSQEGLVMHYSKIAQRNEIPIIMYHVPGRTGGKGIMPGTAIRIAKECSNVAGIKWAASDLGEVMELLMGAPKEFSVLSGEDKLTYSMMCLGAKGVIAATANIIPEQMSRMVRLLLQKKYDEALQIQYKYVVPADKLAFMETNPIPAKTALAMMGLPAGELRLPLCRMSPENEEKARKMLLDMGLLKPSK